MRASIVAMALSYLLISSLRVITSGCHPTDIGKYVQARLYLLVFLRSTYSKPLSTYYTYSAQSLLCRSLISVKLGCVGGVLPCCAFLQINKHRVGRQYMNTSQQFQLRIGVYHHPSLKTSQLIEFLQNQANDYLANQLPQNLMIRQTFIAVFDVITDPSRVDPSEYVGFIVLYSSSSLETFQFAKNCLPLGSGDEFVLLVEMDNTEKKSNQVRGQGEEFCRQQGMLYIRLTLKNPEDLVVNLQRSIYLLIENYYYPNEEERQKTATANYQMQISPSQFILQYSDSEQKIIATSEEKNKVMGLIEQASLMRTGREKEMIAEQEAIDESIENVEKVLNNINRHIKKKLESDWFTNLRHSLYKPIEKQSRTYNKIKLTQEFIDEPSPVPTVLRTTPPRQSIYNSKYNSALQQSIKKLESALMKVVIVLEEEEHGRIVGNKMAQVEVFENSSFDQLAANALRKLEMSANQKNLKLMKEQIKFKVETYIRQLSRGVRNIEKQRTFERSYLAAQKK